MTELNINKFTFEAYDFSPGDWVTYDSDNGTIALKVSDRTKLSFTDKDSKVTGNDGEPVYKLTSFDEEETFAAAQSELSESSGPTFEFDMEELEMVYNQWTSMINMTDEQMQRWDDHPCANKGVDAGEERRDEFSMLIGQPMESWDQENLEIANQAINFIAEQIEMDPENPESGGPGTCPSRWAVNLLNHGYNPFDSFPSGNPQFDASGPQEDSGLVYDADGETIHPTFSAASLGEKYREGFNEYGIRQNFSDEGDLMSVDAIYEAMEPGPPEKRNGFRITEDFLRTLANKEYDTDPPYMMDHSENTLSQIGFTKDIWFDEAKQKLMVMTRTYNTGGDIHDEIVSRLTHEPPANPGGSVGLGQSYKARENQAGEVELLDARIEEFSTTPFPGGYDEGGLRASGSAD